MSRTSLLQEVAQEVISSGGLTLDGLEPLFPSYTREQIRHALKNARSVGLVRVIQRGKGKGPKQGSEPSVYGPGPRAEPKATSLRVGSVWQLAGGPVHIPTAQGRRYQPLGEW